MRRRMMAGILAGAITMAGTATGQTTHKGYEMPPYTVEIDAGAVELRRYGPHTVAEVTVFGGRGLAASRGFRALAGYIFGGNSTDAKIAMTVPVTQIPTAADAGAQGAESWTVRFMMPAGAVARGLPAPSDDSIRFARVAGGRMAVLTFSGLPTAAALARQEARLREWVGVAGLSVAGRPHYMFYDAPMTPPWRRRNEVALPVGAGD